MSRYHDTRNDSLLQIVMMSAFARTIIIILAPIRNSQPPIPLRSGTRTPWLMVEWKGTNGTSEDPQSAFSDPPVQSRKNCILGGQGRQGTVFRSPQQQMRKALQGGFRDFVDFPLNGPFFWRSWRLGGLRIPDWGVPWRRTGGRVMRLTSDASCGEGRGATSR